MSEATPYERLGSEQGLRALVRRFYDLMEELPEAYEIRRLHPRDLGNSREKLFKFLSGWLGGPPLYIQEYGHPRLRARHLPFPIGEQERDQWLRCMNQALEESIEDADLRRALERAFLDMANHMINNR